MIKFHTLTVKNFLSYGDVPTTFLLDKSPTTLVNGKNGHGKSVMADAMSYVLFGKSFRGITNPKLINSVNKKNLEVSITFSDHSHTYKIVRTLSPQSLTVYRDDQKIEEAAGIKDFQDYIETNILKFNHKSFCQTCIIGSSNHTPFLELNTAQRRELVEYWFGINAFSTMNKLLKSRISTWKTDLEKRNHEIEKVKTSIFHLQDFVSSLENQTKSSQTKNDIKIEEKKRQLEAIKEKALDIKSQRDLALQFLEVEKNSIDDPFAIENTTYQHDQIALKINLLTNNIRTHKTDINNLRLDENNRCTTCKQKITSQHVSSCTKELERQIAKNEAELEKLQKQLPSLKSKIDYHTKQKDHIAEQKRRIDILNKTLENLKQQGMFVSKDIKELQEEQETPDMVGASLEDTKRKLQEAKTTLKVLVEQKDELSEKGKVYNAALELLKDTGIKAMIIKQYLPLLNSKVNEYLSLMNFPVQFEMNEEFDDVVKVRGHAFEYKNFSMGEKQRLSLAILFAWRDVAAAKGSVASDILFLDETLDASLDESGTTDLLSIIDSLSKKTNVFVISHKGSLEDKFRSVLKIEKHNGFSRIV